MIFLALACLLMIACVSLAWVHGTVGDRAARLSVVAGALAFLYSVGAGIS